jgi:hypothetical protein
MGMLASRIAKTATLLVLVTAAAILRGKVADPPPLIVEGSLYRSHANELTRIDRATNKVIWTKKIYKTIEPPKYSQMEKDVQWDIISSVSQDGAFIVVRTRRGHEYRVDRVTGAVSKSPSNL